MTNLIDVINQRRSIRKYQTRHIGIETIRIVLEAARFAPSAHNAQPWRFLVLEKKSAKLQLAKAMGDAWLLDLEKDGVLEKDRMELAKTSIRKLCNVPVLILGCITLDDMVRFSDEDRQRSERDLAVQSIAAAIQNILLVAHEEGLGACWFCSPVFSKKAILEALDLPDSLEPQALIALGYPDEIREAPKRKSLETIAFLNRWGNPL